MISPNCSLFDTHIQGYATPGTYIFRNCNLRGLLSFIIPTIIWSAVVIHAIDWPIGIVSAAKIVAVAVVSLTQTLAVAVISTQLASSELAQGTDRIVPGQAAQIRIIVSSVAHAVAQPIVAKLILIWQIRASEIISAEATAAGIVTGQIRNTESIQVASSRTLIWSPRVNEIAISAEIRREMPSINFDSNSFQ